MSLTPSMNNQELTKSSEDIDELSSSDDISVVNNDINFNSIEDLIDKLDNILPILVRLNENLKKNDIHLTKENYSKLYKSCEDLNKENSKFNNILLKKSLKCCIDKKTKKKNINANSNDKKKIYAEILEIMESKEIMLSKSDLMTYIPNYIKMERLNENSGINVEGYDLKHFHLIGKLKLIFEFIKDKVNENEKDKAKIEELFPNNELPAFLTYNKLLKYYRYFIE